MVGTTAIEEAVSDGLVYLFWYSPVDCDEYVLSGWA
jgi:hypothetical protein